MTSSINLDDVTINKKIYIFGIALDDNERKLVLAETEKIRDVEEVIPTIFTVPELSRNKT